MNSSLSHEYYSADVVVGFEEVEYSVSERVGSVEVCVSILGPSGLDLSSDVSIPFILQTEPGSATGQSPLKIIFIGLQCHPRFTTL